MTFTAMEMNSETKCWMVRRYKSDNVDVSKGLVDGRSIRNDDYVEAEIWGPINEGEAIKAAIARESWA
jgi:hypothetical protein